MKLYLIRHAIAQERHLFATTGLPDERRPLTEKGIERMQVIAGAFADLEPEVDKFYQSPLKRAQQTVEILRPFHPKAKVETTENLSPGFSAKKLYQQIREDMGRTDAVALIGHEPDLGHFLSWLLFRQATDHFPFKKGGIAKLDLYEDHRRYLKWLIRPKILL